MEEVDHPLRNLFSAYAEVFPPAAGDEGEPPAFLCLRRGVSAVIGGALAVPDFSLPTQRCFLDAE